MPVVFRSGPYVLYFYSHEPHEPPHVHVRRDRSKAKFWLNPVLLAIARGFSDVELRKIERLVQEHRDALLESWHEYFGT